MVIAGAEGEVKAGKGVKGENGEVEVGSDHCASCSCGRTSLNSTDMSN